MIKLIWKSAGTGRKTSNWFFFFCKSFWHSIFFKKALFSSGADRMNGLQACIYYPMKTSLFLQSLVVTSAVKLYLLVLVGWSTTYLKVKTSVSGLNLTTLVTACDYKKTLVFSQVGKYKLVNRSLDRCLIEQSKQMFWMEKLTSHFLTRHCKTIWNWFNKAAKKSTSL